MNLSSAVLFAAYSLMLCLCYIHRNIIYIYTRVCVCVRDRQTHMELNDVRRIEICVRERERKANEWNGGRKGFTQTAKTLSRFVPLALIIYREISFQSKRVDSPVYMYVYIIYIYLSRVYENQKLFPFPFYPPPN